MSTRRTVVLSEGDAGIFSIECQECPLKLHTDALGQKAPSCVHGIITNMQGAIPLGTCKHYEKDSIVVEGKTLVILCGAP
jgi:hypothetical protein